jgi:hypothetical protein
MHPLAHAESSKKLHGGEVQDWLPIHRWFDESKNQLAYYTHRALRHHTQGMLCAELKFGQTINGISVREISFQHLTEDCQKIPDVSDWLVSMKTPTWVPETITPLEEIINIEARLWNVQPEHIAPLHHWMMETKEWFSDSRHLSMRHHSFGIFEAEEVFGVFIEVDNIRIPTRTLAEHHVRRTLGRIPSTADWLRAIKGEKWMIHCSL